VVLPRCTRCLPRTGGALVRSAADPAASHGSSSTCRGGGVNGTGTHRVLRVSRTITAALRRWAAPGRGRRRTCRTRRSCPASTRPSTEPMTWARAPQRLRDPAV